MLEGTKPERDRQDGQYDPSTLLDRIGPTGAARRLVQVFNGGSMPTTGDHIFLAHPAELDGVESNGGTASSVVDSSTVIPVLVVGAPASSGDLLVATGVGGRWVAERTQVSMVNGYPCAPCAIPETPLTLSWVNALLGGGSTQLIYQSQGLWVSSCENQIQFELRCTQNSIELRVLYFISGTCPTGRSQYCSNLLSKPLNIALMGSVCSPFFVTWTLTSSSCPVLTSNGYTSFTVTE
jgi:hypothetical protein